jgi:ABC-2 type transport system permease protein
MRLPVSVERGFGRLGIDGRQLAVLLAVYLKQDLRGGKIASQFGRESHLSTNRALISIATIYLVLGLSVGIVAFTGIDVFTYSIFLSSFTLFIVAMALVAESGNVILNESETDVLGHLPISSRTQLAVKLANLFLFTLLLAASANVLPAIMGIFSRSSNVVFVIAHSVSTVLVALFATTIVVLSYGILIRMVSKERLDSVVAYSQMALTLVFMLSYQVIPRLIDIQHPREHLSLQWYHFVYPPAWFSGIAMLLIGKWNAGTMLLSLTGILVLLALGSLAFRKMAFNYASLLPEQTALPRPESSQTTNQGRGAKGLSHKVRALFAHYFLRDPVERAVFDLVGVYLRRNREIKVRIYPSLASFVFFPIFILLTGQLNDPFSGNHEWFFALLTIEMVFIVALTVLEGLIFSEHYRAGYIFLVTPIARVGRIYSGFRKLVMLFIFVPGFALMLVLLSVMWRNSLHAILAILPWVPLTPIVLLVPFVGRDGLPLSRKYQKGQQSARNAGLMIGSMICLSIFLAVQFSAIKNQWYWLFSACVFFISPLVYFLLKKIAGESKQLRPQDLVGAE